MEKVTIKNHQVALFAMIGLLFGVVMDCLFRYHVTNLFIGNFLLCSAMFFALAYDGHQSLRLLMTSVVCALVISMPLLPYGDGSRMIPTILINSFIGLFPMMIFIVNAFHVAMHRDDAIMCSYQPLFEIVWTTVPVLLVGFIFGGLANGLILSAAGIFKSVGHNWLWQHYFDNHHVFFIASSMLFFMGISLAQQSDKIISGLRVLVLRISYYLLPILALLTIVYFGLYLTSPYNTALKIAQAYAILSYLSLMGILVFNAYFQAGEGQDQYNYWLGLMIRVYLVALFLITLTTTIPLLKEHYLPMNTIVFSLTIALLTLCYAVSAMLPSGAQSKLIKSRNVVIAVAFLLVMLIINNPFSNPKAGIEKLMKPFDLGPVQQVKQR